MTCQIAIIDTDGIAKNITVTKEFAGELAEQLSAQGIVSVELRNEYGFSITYHVKGMLVIAKGFVGQAILQEARIDETKPEHEEKEFQVWSEGFHEMGGRSGAMFHGRSKGNNLKEACLNLAQKHADFAGLFNVESMTYWGCRIFDNERDARKMFG